MDGGPYASHERSVACPSIRGGIADDHNLGKQTPELRRSPQSIDTQRACPFSIIIPRLLSWVLANSRDPCLSLHPRHLDRDGWFRFGKKNKNKTIYKYTNNVEKKSPRDPTTSSGVGWRPLWAPLHLARGISILVCRSSVQRAPSSYRRICLICVSYSHTCLQTASLFCECLPFSEKLNMSPWIGVRVSSLGY